MRVHVDSEKCQGHNRCYAIAPELFDVDDLGFATEWNDGVVPEPMEDQARRRCQLPRVRDLDHGDGETMTSAHRPPVTDWASDFDHTDAGWVNDPFPIWDELRAKCPVAHSDRYGGTWLPVRHEDVAAVAYDTEHFTSRSVIVSEVRPGDDDLPAPIGIAPPITSDPPFHAIARRLLLPAFAPKPIDAYEPYTRALCNELLDATTGKSEIDAAVDYAQDIPLRVIAKMLGFPEKPTPTSSAASSAW